MDKLNSNELAMVESYKAANVGETEVRKAVFVKHAVDNGFDEKEAHDLLNNKMPRVKRGVYSLDVNASVAPVAKAVRKAKAVVSPEADATVAMAPAGNLNVRSLAESLNVDHNGFKENLVPKKDGLYVAFGNHKDIKAIVKSGRFFPIFVTGLSGNGKTFMIEQVCAELKREMIRFNFTIETDEDDLIGGFRLVNGETKFFKGPIIKAMEMGSVFLADEIDLADPSKIMALQSILEGKGYFIKKTGEFIEPAPGFTIIATANTKGRGSDDGKFIGANILNEAFLERFKNTYEQEYASPAIEKKMINKVLDSFGIDDDEFATKLTDWADVIRKTYADGGVDEIISTRRLVHIVDTYDIFRDKMVAIEKCINRFDDETKEAFLDLYTKIDADVVQNEEGENVVPSTEEVPF